MWCNGRAEWKIQVLTRLSKISFIVLLFLLSELGQAENQQRSIELEMKGKPYRLEIADTGFLRNRGLMYRPSLEQHAGMLFVYPRAGHYRIWMKNTLIPLTVIWLDSEARILQIKNLQPCVSPHCPVFGVDQPARYIIELHSSQSSRFRPGDRLPAILSVQ